MARQMIGGRKTKKETKRHKMQVRRGDRVRVMRGNHAGAEGTVLRVLPAENRVVVEGVNMRKRHQRPSQANPEGGIVSFEAPIAASNVMLLDAAGNATRVRSRRDKDGTRERVSVKSGEAIPRQNS